MKLSLCMSTHTVILYSIACQKVAIVVKMLLFLTNMVSKAWHKYLKPGLKVFGVAPIGYVKGIEVLGSCPYTFPTHTMILYAHTCQKRGHVGQNAIDCWQI